MPIESIDIPQEIKNLPYVTDAENLIDTSNERIEKFMLETESVTENFVTSDFHLVDQALTWIEQNHLLPGRRFCEFGSGFGVATLLASLHGLEAVGIEIEANLVEQASQLADDFELAAKFYCGSFIPRDISNLAELSIEADRVDTQEGDVYEEIGLAMADFDLFFVFPWPGDQPFYEAIFDAAAADNALLLSYNGRNGMGLVRKT